MINNQKSAENKLYISQDFFIETIEVSEVVPHSHDFLELGYVINGSASHVVNGKRIELKKNDYIIIDYGIRHNYDNISGDLVILNCSFKPRVIDNALTFSKSLSDLMNHYLINVGFEISQQQFIYNVFTDNDGRVLDLLNKISDEYADKATGQIQMIRSLLIEIIILTMRKVQKTQRKLIGNSEREIAEIIAAVDENYFDPITLQTFSDKYNRSVSSLSKKFKDQSGYNFSKYIQIKRMEQACRLLSNSDAKVAEIAYECGYTDMKCFNQVFKRIMGTTPTMYRRLIKDK